MTDPLEIAIDALKYYANSYRTIVVTVDKRLEFVENRVAERVALDALKKIEEIKGQSK